MVSYHVSYLTAKCKKPHTAGERLILPAAVAMCCIMQGDKFATPLQAILLSNAAVARRTDDIASDIKVQLIEYVKQSPKYTLQLDVSKDIAHSAQLLVYVRYGYDRKLQEDLFFCNSLQGKTTG